MRFVSVSRLQPRRVQVARRVTPSEVTVGLHSRSARCHRRPCASAVGGLLAFRPTTGPESTPPRTLEAPLEERRTPRDPAWVRHLDGFAGADVQRTYPESAWVLSSAMRTRPGRPCRSPAGRRWPSATAIDSRLHFGRASGWRGARQPHSPIALITAAAGAARILGAGRHHLSARKRKPAPRRRRRSRRPKRLGRSLQ